MVAFPRSSKTLIFVRGPRTELADDTVTEILPAASKRKLAAPKVQAHRPPKPRTSAEGELPSIMVTQDSWVPPTPAQVRRHEATVVGVRRAVPTAAAKPPKGLVSERRYNLTLAFLAIGVGLVCLYLAPLLSQAMESAFAALNR